ncbi:MAG: MBL fold metallo-hydrolase [Thermoleophilia bacterium]
MLREIAPGIVLIDTMLGGMEGVMAAFLVTGPQPALIETGARTSAPVVRGALAELGLGARDLAWIVPTHVHLDHAGGTGILARHFPSATVVTHRRGARHLVDPARLVASSAAVYGHRRAIYGGLDPTPAERVMGVEDGHRVAVGPGRDLVLVETLGHARHHMSVLDELTGTVFAGDALGVRFPGAGLYQALPPPDIDLAMGDRSLRRLQRLDPPMLCPSHYGPVPDPAGDLALAREQLARLDEIVAAAGADEEALARAVDRLLPMERAVAEAGALRDWRRLGWAEANIAGLAGWAERRAAAGGAGVDPLLSE